MGRNSNARFNLGNKGTNNNEKQALSCQRMTNSTNILKKKQNFLVPE